MSAPRTLRRLATSLLLALGACAGTGTGTGTDSGDQRIGTPEAPQPAWQDLFDGRSLDGLERTSFGGEGEVVVENGALLFDFGYPLTGVTVPAAQPPSDRYELEVVAARVDGNDFFCGLTFPVGDAHLTLVLGGWGGAVSGLSSLDGADAANNETRVVRAFEHDRDYTVRLRVTPERVEVDVDDEPLLAADLTGRMLSLRSEVLPCRPLGVCSFSTRARIRALRWRPLVTEP